MNEEEKTTMQETTHAPKLSGADVMALLVCWAGAAAVSWFSKEHAVAVIAAVGAAYYLAKWIILKKEK